MPTRTTKMMLKTTTFLSLILLSFGAHGQPTPADTVIVPLAETSRIIFTVQDRRDLEVLKHYDFQKLFEDILARIAEGDTLQETPVAATDTSASTDASLDTADVYEGNAGDVCEESNSGRIGDSWQSFNLDIGTNNYLDGDQFPLGSEPYAVRPWGSWYVAINSVQTSKLGKNFLVEWGLGVSWYSFKFQEDNITLQQDGQALQFIADTRNVDYIKSKLSATFINASLVPVLAFGEPGRRHHFGHGDGGFRFGLGPYVGYRISSKTKLVYEVDDERERIKDHDSFYLNNLRYGFRLQLGLRSTDLFINYDMNELFAAGKGPELRAISFGLIF